MDMIRHDTRCKQLVAVSMKMAQGVQHHCARLGRKLPTLACGHGDSVDGPGFFKMREAPSGVARPISDRDFKSRSSRRRDSVASTRDECATRSVRALKQGQRRVIFLAGGRAQREPKTKWLQPLAQHGKVLLGQNLGGHHQGRLKSRFHGQQDGGNSHDRFAGADIALQQSVHRIFRGQASADLGDHFFLGTR